ncbi:MAG: alpha-N-arabinofuranosidase [Verrucomicrobia bacterium]|nr:alpha-N-arabinofuranosidase [Verrucomicrobiota bacterium]
MKSTLLRSIGILAACLLAAAALPAADQGATLTLDASKSGPVINKNIYGHFSEHLGRCIYEGIWVGEDSPIPNTKGYRNDVIAALRALKVPQLRWPGGCFADEYHWRDGIGPREKRPSMINTHWGGVVENNHFGTHEFLDFCELLGIAPYVCLNVGSGTVQEAMEWVEYMTSDAQSPMANLRRAHGRDKPWKVPYLAIGNESWGCGGNMTASFYADNFRRYNTFVKNYIPGPAGRIARIACGPNEGNYEWTETLMKDVGNRMNGLALHYYTLPTGNWRGSKGSSTNFAEDQWFSTLQRTLKMEELVTKHSEIMDRYDPQKRVGLVVDEWGTWYDVEPGTNGGFLYQQSTMRDALVAALNLHIFHAHADRVTMANIAQIINVLQSVILTDKEKMLVTPTYHVMEMFNVHQGATSLPVALTSPDYAVGESKIPAVSASASRDAAGKIHLSFANCDPNQPVTVACRLTGVTAKSATGRVLTAPAMNTHNTFSAPDAVKPAAFTGATVADDTLTFVLPSKSVVILELN